MVVAGDRNFVLLEDILPPPPAAAAPAAAPSFLSSFLSSVVGSGSTPAAPVADTAESIWKTKLGVTTGPYSGHGYAGFTVEANGRLKVAKAGAKLSRAFELADVQEHSLATKHLGQDFTLDRDRVASLSRKSLPFCIGIVTKVYTASAASVRQILEGHVALEEPVS